MEKSSKIISVSSHSSSTPPSTRVSRKRPLSTILTASFAASTPSDSKTKDSPVSLISSRIHCSRQNVTDTRNHTATETSTIIPINLRKEKDDSLMLDNKSINIVNTNETLKFRIQSQSVIDKESRQQQQLQQNCKSEKTTLKEIPSCTSISNDSHRSLSEAPTTSKNSHLISPKQIPKCDGTENTRKKRKVNPFRVKVGCVVALRYRSQGPRYINVNPRSNLPVENPKIISNSRDFSKEERSLHYLKDEASQRKIVTSHEDSTDGSGVTNSNAPGSKKRKHKEEIIYTEMWIDPIPGKDDGLALIGKRIRCIFPKSVLEAPVDTMLSAIDKQKGEDECENKESNVEKKSTCRILEGEVICIPGYGNNGVKDDKHDIGSSSETSIGVSSGKRGILVKLLVDKDSIKSMRFLSVEREADHYSMSSANGKAEISVIEKKRRKYEEIIRGKDKVIVQALLDDIVGTGVAPTKLGDKKNESRTLDDASARWVVRKRIPVLSKNPKKDDGSRFVGDGNDNNLQQEKNWRWIAGYHSSSHFPIGSSNAQNETEERSLLVGEVLKVVAAQDSSSVISEGSSTGSNINTLAMVTLRRLYLPEQTFQGRSSHHRRMEMFDDTTVIRNKNGMAINQFTYDAESYACYQVPVEDLVVISRKVQRTVHDSCLSGKSILTDNECNSSGVMIVKQFYDIKTKVFLPRPASNKQDLIEKNTLQTILSDNIEMKVCHRCRCLKHKKEMRCCSEKSCWTESKVRMLSETDVQDEGRSWWCGDCCRALRNKGVFTLYQHSNWRGPCCVGVCDCIVCSIRKKENVVEENFKDIFHQILLTKNINESEKSVQCETCRRSCIKNSVRCSSCSRTMHKNCSQWERDLVLSTFQGFRTDKKEVQPQGTIRKDSKRYDAENKTKDKKNKKRKKENRKKIGNTCYQCHVNDQFVEFHTTSVVTNNDRVPYDDTLKAAWTLLQCMPPHDFDLPHDFSQNLPLPELSPNTSLRQNDKNHLAEKTSKATKKRSQVSSKSLSKSKIKSSSKLSMVPVTEVIIPAEKDEFKPTCCRFIPYDPSKKPIRSSNNSAAHAARTLELMRTGGRKNVRAKGREAIEVEKKSTSRTARANQRRMLRDIALFGLPSYGVKDTLSGCEQSLRFGKSFIHGWGVFTDEDINSGDLIVEYRGVLIGNAVADKREKEYEIAKIGSDYMFRIDADVVCDATHQGNLARFINASCNPNCYTQIITINGIKRIAIYAKREIMPGEELSYDYKFDPEYNESKRIPCNCGSSDCRGFMNWDKRYVAIPTNKKS